VVESVKGLDAKTSSACLIKNHYDLFVVGWLMNIGLERTWMEAAVACHEVDLLSERQKTRTETLNIFCLRAEV
jgi:hypothetical protein